MSVPFHADFIKNVHQDSFLDNQLLEALNSTSPTTIRKNPLKKKAHFDGEIRIPWCENGFVLPERPIFTLDPFFHAGAYYPQEAGSMLLEHVLKSISLNENAKVLDLCAAPGGKSTLIASHLNGKGMLVSNEVVNQRAKILRENITKWGYSNCIVTNNDPSDFERLPYFFDCIVVDAPCSGEGMFRKDPNARQEWSNDAVNLCTSRQKRIVADVWPSLAKDGYLIYSTCTFNAHENEENIAWILANFDAELIQIQVPKSFTAGRENVGIYGIPGISETEGFFIAVLQKKDSERSSSGTKKSSTLRKAKEMLDVEKFANLSNSSVYEWNTQLLSIPSAFESEFLTIQAHLHIVKWGTSLGEIARKGIIPSEDLALNPELLIYSESIELDKQMALQFLHGDTFPLPSTHGFKLMNYNNTSLGWIKHVGNRFNNLYPKEWRIRMEIR